MTDCVLLSETDSINLAFFLGETLGMAVVDSGCSRTVCGHTWFQAYYDTLSVHDRKLIEKRDSDNRFRFGDGETYCSMKSVDSSVCHEKLVAEAAGKL